MGHHVHAGVAAVQPHASTVVHPSLRLDRTRRSGIGDAYIALSAAGARGRRWTAGVRATCVVDPADRAGVQGAGPGEPGVGGQPAIQSAGRAISMCTGTPGSRSCHPPSATTASTICSRRAWPAAPSGVLDRCSTSCSRAVVEWTDVPTGPSSSRHVSRTTIAPGVRTGRNARESQTVIGVALPISIVEDARDVGVFVYFSYETRFTSR